MIWPLHKRKTTVSQVLVNFLGEGQEELAQGGGLLLAGRVEDQAIVLIGDKSLFVSPLRAERQPAPCHWRQAMPLRAVNSMTAGSQAIIEDRNQTRRGAGRRVRH